MNRSEQEIKRGGKILEKEILAKQVLEHSKEAKTPEQLKRTLEQHGITTYERNSVLTGVWNQKKTRKYRLKKLGVDILNLDRSITKEQERKQRLKRNRGRDH